MINKKMQNFEVIGNRVIFKNYLLDISNKDFERNTLYNRHFIGIYGIAHILKSIYLEIKEKVPNKDVLKFLIPTLNVPKSTLECWISGRNPIPIVKVYQFLDIWKNLCKKSQSEFDQKIEGIFNSKLYYSTYGSGRRIRLPKELTSDLAYMLGFILADGYVKNDNKLLSRGKFMEYTISMCDGSEIFLNYLKDLFYKLFEVECNIHYSKDKKGSWYTLRCTSKPIHRFFCDVIGLKRGT